MQHYWVVQIRRQIFTIRLLRTTALFIKAYPVFLLESGPIGRHNETCGAIGPPCRAKEPPTAEAS